MIVKIGIEVSYDELEDFRNNFFIDNGVELPIDKAKKIFIERFLADRSDYIDTDNICVYFV